MYGANKCHTESHTEKVKCMLLANNKYVINWFKNRPENASGIWLAERFMKMVQILPPSALAFAKKKN